MTPENPRHEFKLAVDLQQRDTLLRWLRLHRLGFSGAFPERHVNNVYFDNLEYGAAAESLAGSSRRAKVRIRWYGSIGRPRGVGALEIKLRRNQVGWKLRWPVTFGEETVDPRRLPTWLRRRLPAEARPWLDAHPLPVLLNGYRRSYFVSRDGTVRATVDDELRVWDLRLGTRLAPQRSIELRPTVILELKLSREDGPRLRPLLGELPARVSRHSKYVAAVERFGRL